MSDHRLARFIVWLAAVLAWFAVGCPQRTRAQQRHQRYADLPRTRLVHAVRNIIIIRAAELMPERPSPPQLQRPRFCPSGFRRARIRARGPGLRAWGGVWLRRQLNVRGSIVAQAIRLLEALRHLRGLAACFAWRRRHVFLTSAIIATRPPAQCVRTLAYAAIAAADSS